MRQRSFQHVGEDFHVAVRVGREPCAGNDAVLVDHPKIAEAHVLRVVVVTERKGVTAVEPVQFVLPLSLLRRNWIIFVSLESTSLFDWFLLPALHRGGRPSLFFLHGRPNSQPSNDQRTGLRSKPGRCLLLDRKLSFPNCDRRG